MGHSRSICLVCEEGVEEEFLHGVSPTRCWGRLPPGGWDAKRTARLTGDMIWHPEECSIAALWKRQGEVVLWEVSFIVVVGVVKGR